MEEDRSKYYDKARKICAQQESSKTELFRKLRQKQCPPDLAEELTTQMEEEGYIDEDRFAMEYVRSKSEGKEWGRLRIQQGLKEKGLEEGTIDRAMDALTPEQEEKTLKKFLAKKWAEELQKGKDKPRDKTIAAAERKGHPLPKILELMEKVSGPDGFDRIHGGGNKGGEET